MLKYDVMLSELRKLSTEAVEDILAGLHELKMQALWDAARDVRWERSTEPGGKWPVRTMDIGNPNDPRTLTSLGTHVLVGSCNDGTGPDDPNHQVARHCGEQLECSCGKRSDRDGYVSGQLHLRWRQAHANPRVWPTEMRTEASGLTIPYYQVCKEARSVDDADHAPNSIGMQCLCGRYLGVHSHAGNSDKYLPAY